MPDDEMRAMTFTMHVDFISYGDDVATRQATMYAEGLTRLCPEIEMRSARVSPAGNWRAIVELFCNEPGPCDPDERCDDPAGHEGLHSWQRGLQLAR